MFAFYALAVFFCSVLFVLFVAGVREMVLLYIVPFLLVFIACMRECMYAGVLSMSSFHNIK